MSMRKMIPIRTEYFDWLLNFNLGGEGHKYLGLCKMLHEKKFRWFVHNDDNRCEDGIALRHTFIDSLALSRGHLEVEYFLNGDCTIFELLVALAKRINDYTYDLNPDHDNTASWFFEMLSNLRLDRFRGKEIARMDEVFIDDVLERLMDRTYDYNGNGSLFPLKRRAKKDMSKVEIWYQLMSYLEEKAV